MPTPLFICGAECGLAAVGTLGAGSVEHWSSVTGTPTVVTSGPSPMRSARCFRLNPTATTYTLRHVFPAVIASPATVVGRFYIYFATLPSGNAPCFWPDYATQFTHVRFVKATNTIEASVADVGVGGGVVVTAGQWYRIDFKAVFGATNTMDVQVDGVAVTQASQAFTAKTVAGSSITQSNTTSDVYYDDIIVSGTAADYPIGAGTVAGLYPSGDGTHVYNATGDFLDGGTAQAALAAAGSQTDTWVSLRSKADGGLSTTVDNSNFVTNALGSTGEYLRFVAEDLPGGVGAINGVAHVSTHHNASATANTQCLFVVDQSAGGSTPSAVAKEITVLGTAASNVWTAGVSFPAVTIHTVYKCAAVAETTGAWTAANVDDLGWIWGSTDVTPDAYLDGLCLEVDYAPSGPADITGTVTISASVAATVTGTPTTFGTAALAAATTVTVAGTVNTPPAVVLNSPADAASTGDSTPTFDFTGTDPNGDDVRYELELVSTVSSYSETEQNSLFQIDATTTAVGQSFNGVAVPITTAKFLLAKTGSPTGNAVARLYAHTGTYGTTSRPTGAALATSNNVDVTTLSGTPTLTTFTFPTPFTPTANTKYCVDVAWTYTSGANYITVHIDEETPTHAGNASYYDGTWAAYPADVCFYLLSQTSYVSGTDSGFANPDNGADTDPFTSGENIQYTPPSALAVAVYSWRVRAKDPAGTNSYGAWTAARTLTIFTAVSGTALISIPVAATATGMATTPPVVLGTALITSAVTVDVAGTVIAEIVTGTALFTESVAVTAAATVTHFVAGTAALTEAVTATVAGIRTVTGSALIEITGNASATVAARTIFGTALISSSAEITAAGTSFKIVTGTALISQSAVIDVAGTVTAEVVSGTALISSAVAVTAAGVPTTYGTVLVTELVAVTAAGVPTTYGTAAVTESVAITAAGTPGVTGTAALTESVAVTVAGTATAYGTALISQSVAVTSIGTTAGEAVGTALISIPAAMTVTGTRTVAATAALTVPVAVAVVGRRDVRGTAAITMAATVTVAGTRSGIVSGTGQVAMSVAVSVAATPVRYGTATLTADVQIAAVGVSFQVGAGTALITSSVVVTATGRWSARDAYTATWTLTYTGTLEVAARATADFDYSGGWDTGGTATVDHDYSHSWELV